MGRSPLVPATAGFLAGIALTRASGVAVWPCLALSGLAALLLFRRRHALLWLAVALGPGAVRQALDLPPKVLLRDRVEGVVDGPPRIYRTLDQPGPEGEPLADGSFRVGGVQVRFFRQPVTLIGGERVVVEGKARKPRRATNPGQFDYGALLERQGVHTVLTLREPPTVLEGPSAWSRARAWVRSLLDRGTRADVGAFLGAIVLGRREAVSEDLLTQFQRSGTAHLLAISGQNLVIVLAALWAVLTILGLQGRVLTSLLLGILGIYVLLIGDQVSVLRAYLMVAAFLGADLAWRRREPTTSLAAAALVLCAADPGQVADLGFQLSFAAVLGLVHVAPIFHVWTGPGGALWNRFRAALGVSVAAWLATAPLVQESFHLITPGIVFANLLLVPLLSLEFVLGLVHLPMAALGAGAVSGWAATAAFDLIRLASDAVSSLPLAYAYAPPPGLPLLAAYYAGLALWTAWCRRAPLDRRRPLLVVLLLVPLGLAGPLRHRAPEGLLYAQLDVGRGSCAVLEWPGGRTAMVDCGSLDLRDAGADVAAPYLWDRGITRLDTLVLTHPDADHVNGARSIVELFRVRRVVVTRAFKGLPFAPGPDVVVVERENLPYRLGDLEILGPPPWEKFGRPVAANETSVVVRTSGLLLPGDVEERGVEELLNLPDLRARVLVLPHHGKHHRRHADLVRRVDPEMILVSGPEGYASPAVLEALPRPARLTGREGAIELELLPDVVRPWRR